MSEAANKARKIVTEFEEIFGDLTATESDWLFRQIANATQENHAAPCLSENDIAALCGGKKAQRRQARRR